TYKNISLEMDGGSLTIDGGLNTTMTDHSSRISYGDNTITLNNGAIFSSTATSSGDGSQLSNYNDAQEFYEGIILSSGTTLSVVSDGTGTLSAEGLKCANGITVPDGATLNLQGLAQINAQGHSGTSLHTYSMPPSGSGSDRMFWLATGIGVMNHMGAENTSYSFGTSFYMDDFDTAKVGAINITDCGNVTTGAELCSGQSTYTADAIGYGFDQGSISCNDDTSNTWERKIETAPNGSITNSTIQTDGEVGRNFTIADDVHFKNAAGAVMTPYYLIARTTDTPDSGTTGNLCCNVGTEANFLSGEVLSGSVASNSYVTMRFLIPEDDPNVTHFWTALKNDDSSDGVELSEVTLVRGNTSDAQNAKTVPLYYRYDHNTTAQFGVDDYTVVRTKMKTSTADDAGTDANLKVQLLDANGGVLGQMGYAGGGYGDYDPLESGSTDAVTISLPENYSAEDIKGISVMTDGSGKKPGWKIQELDDTAVYTTASGFTAQKTALFTDDSLTVDQWIVEAGRQYTFSLDEANPTQYQVKVKTSDIDKAGTDANIKIDLQNDDNGTVKNKTGAVDIDDHTDQEQDDILEKGDTNTFNIAAASPLEAVNKIILTTDGAGTGPDWHVDNVTVTPYFNGNTVDNTSTFEINDWIREENYDYAYFDANAIASAADNGVAYLSHLCSTNRYEGIQEDLITALANFDLKDLRMKISQKTEIKETLLSLIKARGKGFLLEKYDDDGNFQFSWRFEPEIMGDHLKDLNLNITKTDSAAPPVSAVGSYTQSTLLHFDQQGPLGLTASIRYALDPAKFAEGTAVDIYHVSENGTYQKIASTSVLEFGMVRFNVSDGGDYLIVGTSAPNNLVKPAVNTTANATNVNTGLNA
ncbi:MAG: PLAT/LH2 domain-containing protein, partial [Oscillospiraceae bacterium]|nr:PLAT/LH2 domain-containing protein [Oscillospiraceae bacterium]